MTRISNYEELITERKKIEGRIREHKAIINEGLKEIKEKIEPFLNLIPILNIFKTQESNNSVLKFLASLGIDLFVGQRLLSKSNWLTRLAIPVLLKGVSAFAFSKRKPKENGSAVLLEQ